MSVILSEGVNNMKFKRLACAVLAIAMVGVNLGGLLPVFAADGAESSQDAAGRALIPFDKIWDDADLAYAPPRPSAVTVSLYRYTGEFNQSTATLVETANVSAAAAWHYDFDISNQPLFDDDNAYKYKVVEGPVDLYEEESHVDPEVKFIPPEGSDDWAKHPPCNELDITTGSQDKYPIVVSKKGDLMVVWSLTELTAAEKEVIKDSILAIHHGVGNPSFTFVNGEGEFSDYGLTVTREKVTYHAPSDWSLIFFGRYKPTSENISAASITNKHEVEYTSFKFKKVWDDDADRDGKRTTVTAQLYADGAIVEGKTKEISKDDGKTYEFTNLPKCSGYVNAKCQEIKYSVQETDLDTDVYTASYKNNDDGTVTVTNKHIPEKAKLLIQKTWSGNKKAGKVVFRITGGDVDTTVELQASDKVDGKCTEWCKEIDESVIENFYRYKNGQIIEYSVEEESIDGGGFIVYGKYESEDGQKSVEGKWNVEKSGSGDNWVIKNSWVSADYQFDGSSVFYIKKVDQKDNPIAGAEFSVNGDTKTTDAQGLIEITIPNNQLLETETKNYVIKEIKAEGYDVDSDEAKLDVEIESVFSSFDEEQFTNMFSKKFTFTALGNRNYEWDPAEHIFTLENKRSLAESFTIKKSVVGVSARALTDLEFKVEGPDDFGNGGEMTLKASEDCEISDDEITCKVNGGIPTGEYKVTEGNAEIENFSLVKVTGDGKSKEVKKDEKVVYEITNEYEVDKVTYTVVKIWDDAHNQDGKRPDMLTVNLLNGEDVVKSKDLSDKNKISEDELPEDFADLDVWIYEFEDLPKADKNNWVIGYMAEEMLESDDYEQIEAGSDEYVMVFVNYHELEVDPCADGCGGVTPPITPDTGMFTRKHWGERVAVDNSLVVMIAVASLTSIVGIAVLVRRKK